MGLVSLVGGTWFGGLIGHCIVVPLWTLSPVPAVIAIAMLCAGGEWLAYGAIILVPETSRGNGRDAQRRALKRGHLGACSVRRNWYRSLDAA